MPPPELSQRLEAQAPVLPITRDVEHRAAVHCPHIQVAPVTVKDIHQPLHLHAQLTCFIDQSFMLLDSPELLNLFYNVVTYIYLDIQLRISKARCVEQLGDQQGLG